MNILLSRHPGSEARDARDPALFQRRGFGTHSLLTLRDDPFKNGHLIL